MNILDALHFIGGLAPDADALAGTKATDIFEVQGEGAFAILWVAAIDGATNHTVTAVACDDTSASSTSAVAFRYKAMTTFDTMGAWTEATAAGFATSSTADNIYVLFVPASELASTGYKYLKFQTVEGNNQPVDAMILCGVVNPRYQAQPSSLID